MGLDPSLSSASWFPQPVSGDVLLVRSHRGASSFSRVNGKVRLGICAVSPIIGRPSPGVVAVALLVNESVWEAVRSCSSSSPERISTLPFGSGGLALSASNGPVFAGICNEGGSNDELFEKRIALPAGICPIETTKRTGLVLARRPSHDPTTPAACSVFGLGCERKTKGTVVVV